MVFLLVS